MRWLMRLFPFRRPARERPLPLPEPDGGEALARAEADWLRVHAVADRAQRLKVQNGFAAAIGRSMGESRGGRR